MNHQPFEEWLLNDTSINAEQKRELEAHVRTCAYCAALMKTDKVLHDLRMALPVNGFTARFEARLAARKAADRKRRALGFVLFAVAGSALLFWFASPYLSEFLASPAGWIAALVEWGVFFITTLMASLQAGAVILDVLVRFLPPFAWMVAFSGAAAVSLVWSISIWRFARWGAPQGV
ncbi:MAG: hypothetical protein DCC56_09565 [Anaerolineae bacterium]|nr:MAG: hypothetical protein DCC56_09565 [Anaerolineae bacterium]WKZ45163.1 MAG: hypothetical protein QY302_05170 [Anaerolineales bacterium]